MLWSDGEHQAIRQLAYSLWEKNGRPYGNHLAHWLLAESAFETARFLSPDIRRVLIASNRAFVFVKNIEHRFIGKKATHAITSWNFITQWENGGNTPAKNKTTHVQYDVFERTIRHRTEFCVEIIVHGDVRTETCQFSFAQQGRHNGLDEQCLRDP
ncbi:MAG TPA: DUF2934 domain-containing protein [Roseiarcus sp.]|nr:DUF2934 domain-containing protein [Roseiarcus sp.]